MHTFRTGLIAAIAGAPFLAAHAQETPTVPLGRAAPSLSVTTVRVGGIASVRAADGRFSIQADRIDIAPTAGDTGTATTLILESMDAGQDVRLQVTPSGSAQPITFVAARLTLTRSTGSGELQVRGANRRAP